MVTEKQLPFELELIRSYKNDFFINTGKTLKCFIKRKKRYTLSLQELYDVVEGLNPSEHALNSRWRPRELADFRKIFCVIALERKFTPGNVAKIIKKNHTTPVQLAGLAAGLLKTDPEFRRKYNLVRKTIKKYEDKHNDPVQTGANAEPVLPARL